MNKKKMSKVFAAAVMGFTIGGQHLSQAYASEVNTPPVLSARDAMIHVGDNFNPLDYATAYDAEDGDVTKNIFIQENTVDTNKVGVYHVRYDAYDSKTEFAEIVETTVTVIEKVEENTAPVLTSREYIAVGVNGWYDAMNGVKAIDEKDGDITNQVTIISNNVDLTKRGEYEIVYSVTNSAGKVSTATTKVYTFGTPVIDASDITLQVGDEFDSMNGVHVSDLEDGDITSNLQVVYNGVDTSKAGTYQVLYTANDNGDVNANIPTGMGEKWITVTVVEKVEVNTAPVLTSREYIAVGVNGWYDAMNGVKAIDEKDGDITNQVTIISNNVDLTKRGEYEIVYSVTNSAGKVSTATTKVYTFGTPVIDASDITLQVGDEFDPMNGVHVSDLEDGDITSNIQVVYNGVDTSKAGTYQVLYTANDNGDVNANIPTGMGEKWITVTIVEKVEEEKPEVIEPTTPETGKEEEKGMIKEAVTEEKLEATTKGEKEVTVVESMIEEAIKENNETTEVKEEVKANKTEVKHPAYGLSEDNTMGMVFTTTGIAAIAGLGLLLFLKNRNKEEAK